MSLPLADAPRAIEQARGERFLVLLDHLQGEGGVIGNVLAVPRKAHVEDKIRLRLFAQGVAVPFEAVSVHGPDELVDGEGLVPGE